MVHGEIGSWFDIAASVLIGYKSRDVPLRLAGQARHGHVPGQTILVCIVIGWLSAKLTIGHGRKMIDHLTICWFLHFICSIRIVVRSNEASYGRVKFHCGQTNSRAYVSRNCIEGLHKSQIVVWEEHCSEQRILGMQTNLGNRRRPVSLERAWPNIYFIQTIFVHISKNTKLLQKLNKASLYLRNTFPTSY